MAAASPPQQRRMVFYRGRVQGVGFRYTTQAVATRFAVTGFVQNLPDGRVLVVTEGVEAEIDRFLAAVMEQMGHYVSGVQSNIVPAEGGFRGFSVRF